MRTTSSSNKFSVFDFNADDERIEKASRNLLGKFSDPSKSDDSPVTKYKFLQCFAQGTKIQQKDFSNELLDVDDSPDAMIERISVLDGIAISGSLNHRPTSNSRPTYLDSGCFFSGANSYGAITPNLGGTSTSSKHLDSSLPQLLSDNLPVGINLDDDDDSVELSSSSIPASDLAENKGSLGEQMLEHGFGGCDTDTVVVVFPDYIRYGDVIFTESTEARLTFSCSCIKVEGSAVYGMKGPFSFEWRVTDIVNILSVWCESVKTAIVNLRLKSKETKVAENAKKNSGIVELNFAVNDPYWSERQESIKSLDVRYKAKWNVVLDIETAKSEGAFVGQNSIFLSKPYCSNLDESFEDVIYPKGDSDAVSISKRDVELLQPETFINDTIIDFYIKYLKNKIKPGEKHRFHFFNSFFFRKLADLDKDPSRACEGRAAFQRVRKWTRKVNLFEKDYIFIPVNFSLHWSLIVICHPGEVANIKDEVMEKKSPKVPCILHMDSIEGSHRGLKNLIQSYLCEEWKERHTEPAEDVSSKFLDLRFVRLELPQQENSFDCGLFLLHYVELFVEQAPVNFSLFEITKFSNFLNKDWFLPAEASLKRAHIKKLIYEIVEDNSQKVPPAACDDKYSPQLPDVNGGDTGIEFLQERCNSTETCDGSYSNSNADQEIGIIALAPTPLRGVQCFGESELVFEEFLEPVVTAVSLTDGNYKPFGQIALLNRAKNVMSPIEEGEETACSPTDEAGGQEVAIVTEPWTTSSSAKNLSPMESRWFQGISMDPEENEKGDVFSGTSSGGSLISSELPTEEDHPEAFLAFIPDEEKDKCECSSASSDGLAACIVEDSQEANETHDVSESENSPHLAGILALSNQEADSVENTNLKVNNRPPVSELDQQAAKRPRLMAPEGGRRLTRNLSKDLH